MHQLGLHTVAENKAHAMRRKKKEKSSAKIPSVWLKTDDLRVCMQRMPYSTEKKLLQLDEKTYRQFRKIKRPARHLYANLIWVLPPIILEDKLQFYQQAVRELVIKGFRLWQIGHLSQLSLFQHELSYTKRRREKGRKGIEIGCDFTLNIINTLGLQFLREIGVRWAQFSVESDKMGLLLMNRNKKGSIKAGLTVYGRPPLFTTRITADFFRYGQIFVSPRGEKFELQTRWGQTLALPEKPFSLLHLLPEQPLADLDYVVIDITGRHHSPRDVSYIFDQLQGKGKSKFPSTFNYTGVLQ